VLAEFTLAAMDVLPRAGPYQLLAVRCGCAAGGGYRHEPRLHPVCDRASHHWQGKEPWVAVWGGVQSGQALAGTGPNVADAMLALLLFCHKQRSSCCFASASS
jgi:hypothetical protein